MPTLPRITLLAALAVSAVMIGGCGATPPPEPSPSPSASPVFASEEEALAAATEAYAAYQGALDDAFTTLADQRLPEVASGEALEEGVAAVEEYRRQSHRQVGATTIDTISLVDPGPALAGEEFQIYACLDVTDVDVVDETGTSITPPDRILRFPLIAALGWQSDQDRLVVNGEEQWDGADFCD